MATEITLTDVTDSIAALVRSAEQRGYERGNREGHQRGVSETMRKIQQAVLGKAVLASDSSNSTLDRPDTNDDAAESLTKVEQDSRKRAPKGLVREVITRELRLHPGKTAIQIEEGATTVLEKMIAAPSYRSELRKGRGDGRYRDENGKWFLVEEEKTEGGLQSNPSAFG